MIVSGKGVLGAVLGAQSCTEAFAMFLGVGEGIFTCLALLI
jgi:hypothetical protein